MSGIRNLGTDYVQYLTEGSNAIKAQEYLMELQAQAENRLQPTMTAQQMSSLKGQTMGLMGLYGDLYQPAQQLQQRYATDQIRMMGGLGANATQSAMASLDPTTRGIYDTFGQQALTDLQAGSFLNSQETNQAQQAARAAAAARGVSFSRQGIDLEVLNTYNMGQRRLAQRQGVAQQAYQMGAGQQQIGLQGFLSPAFGASQQYGLTGLVGGGQSTYAAAGQSAFLSPESQYLANIRSNRIQQQNADAAAKAQRQAGFASGAGSLIGSAMMAFAVCWVARKVYGTEDNRWRIFRAWLLTEAPEWLYNLYREHGEEFAEYISDKPILKRIVKAAMDLVVEPRLKLIQAN
jgi:hypothetical protein